MTDLESTMQFFLDTLKFEPPVDSRLKEILDLFLEDSK